MKPTYESPWKDELGNPNVALEDRLCRDVALSMPWMIPAYFYCASDLPHDVEFMLSVLGFEVTRSGVFYRLVEPDGWRKHTDGFSGKIYSPLNTLVMQIHYKPYSHHDSNYTVFTKDGVKMVEELLEAKRLAHIEWQKSLPWWDLRRYF